VAAMNGAAPTADEIAEFERRLELNGGRFTWDQYVAIINEFAERRPPNRDVPAWDEPFEL